MSKNFNVKLFFVVFALLNLLLSSYFIDTWTTPNTVSRALPVLTYYESGTIKIDAYAEKTGDKSKVGDHYYSDKAPLPTFLMIPIYGAAKMFGMNDADSTYGKKSPVYIWKSMSDADGRQWVFEKTIPILALGSFFMGSLPFVLILLLALLSIYKVQSALSPIWMVMLAFYGSFLFVFAGTYFGHLFAGFLLLASYLFLKHNRFFLSGIFLGLSFLCEYTLGIAFPIWFLLIYLNKKSFKQPLLFFSGMLPSIAAIMVYNYLITGYPQKMLNAYHDFHAFKELGNNYGFKFPAPEALWGLSFSRYMGIFIFTPVLLMVLFYGVKKIIVKGNFVQLKSNYLLVFSIAFFLLIASFFTWWGGWSYGPRYLIPLVVLLVYEGVSLLARINFIKSIYIALTLLGLLTAWLAKSTLMFMIPDKLTKPEQYLNPINDWLIPAFKKDYFNGNNLFTTFLDLSPKTASFLWLFLFAASVFILGRWFQKLVDQGIIELKPVAEALKQSKKIKNKNKVR